MLVLCAGTAPISELMRRAGKKDLGRLIQVALIVLPAAWGMNSAGGELGLTEAVGFGLYVAVPSILLGQAARSRRSSTLFDWLAILAIWLPLASGWPRMPAGGVVDSEELRRMLGLAYLLVAFTALRPVSDLGYRWSFRAAQAWPALVALVFCAAGLTAMAHVGVLDPGRWIGGSGPAWRQVGVFLGTVLPAEVLHRGLVFGLFQKGAPGRSGPYPALAFSAFIYALAAAGGTGMGGWQAFIPALYVGGWLCWCALRTGSLIPGILVHGILLLFRW